jgi:hypothetical protein
MLNPWFMDDTNPDEREAGMSNPWAWSGSPHWFFEDLGISYGMRLAAARCDREHIDILHRELSEYAPACWEAFQRGEWPPHTPGFVLAGAGAR